ncbi:MAG: hypothetical protein V1799_15655 [bacterium]
MEDRWIRYNPRLKLIARTLRNNMTLGEILLWHELKGKKLLGYCANGLKLAGHTPCARRIRRGGESPLAVVRTCGREEFR